MRQVQLYILAFLCSTGVFAQGRKAVTNKVPSYQNIWTKAPAKVPSNTSVDSPLMGNGDVTMTVGFKGDNLRYYLSKNDFWRLFSQSDNLSGPRTVGFVDLKIEGLNDAVFSARQALSNGVTTCLLVKNDQKTEVKSWVSATDNLIFIELKAIAKEAKVSIGLATENNRQAKQVKGSEGNVSWFTRAFEDSVDIPTEVAVALKVTNQTGTTVTVKPGKTLLIAIAVESKFKKPEPLSYVLNKIKNVEKSTVKNKEQAHDLWWSQYWSKSSVSVQDTVLMKAYYQGLYTMAACSRDLAFPPGIFGWVTTDTPSWNGDYHLNYNHQAPFYSLYGANRVEQGEPHDAPLLDFMPRGEWYAKNVTHTRGILYPVGIGPLGIEVTRNHPRHQVPSESELGGLFFGQRSNTAYGLLNMAQYWRSTYDEAYGKKIYPYALATANFWEDYLKFENGRYVIYGDAVHEGSGKDKNSILSLGLVRNAFNLMIDLSSTLKIDQDRQEKWKDILNKLSAYPVQERKGKKVFRYTEEGVDWWVNNGLGIQHIYPSNGVTLDSSEDLLMLSRNTIDDMKRFQDSNTSNSFFMAAIRVGYNPSVVLDELRKYALHTYPNGFQLNNPHGIENSCTVTNALNEMLCMSVGNIIRLFSGLPKGQNASFENIRTWGAFLVSAKLTNSLVSDFKIKSEKGKLCIIVNPWPDKTIQVIRNGKKAESVKGDRFTLVTVPNEMLEFKPE